MLRENIVNLLSFIEVARECSFTKAAARLGVTQSTLSHSVKTLEERLGVKLLIRTTRNVAPTDAGEQLLNILVPRLGEIDEKLNDLASNNSSPVGNIRIATSEHAADAYLWPKVKEFLAAWPKINVELFIDNGFNNIVAERFDAGVRLGEFIEKDMVAVRISPDFRMKVVGSADYFSRHSAPVTPDDLHQHECINFRLSTSGGIYCWEFARAGQDIKVKVKGRFIVNTVRQCVEAASAGLGLAYVPEDLVNDALASGELVQVLEEWCPVFPGYFLYYPNRQQHSNAFHLFIEAVRRHPF
ncbi:UNVERIFIED_ORG: DNA-binding transcriptional LysR family regulator [Kosakonia oryzae]|uniref:DNA-binding transcriptional regulator, LysR family n=2 Tax=Kosakonia radicincitans TaxID=283686 RepID=A0AAX2EM66_9ENTR|nr:LysR family transcriptional regulator [Kosakonia radicincitans]MDP9564906.1 DNA-binding transcriptional LysR family regulator [Kosakonia oryzae]SFD93884.1 DNA-binding transcriptional regulator, LysR family [Kosakonia radicincitans]SFQ98001.1 DNA-binding transcriptional regulator, LysR family [Kosakonia radicincitans]SFT41582.1 DNA-binding transcriptional regulator, LysR family [Kosakonia radicincitans]SFX11384.1 DNA-binding transcriptional regulator, LysR family [Kosakonia radicincitans]